MLPPENKFTGLILPLKQKKNEKSKENDQMHVLNKPR